MWAKELLINYEIVHAYALNRYHSLTRNTNYSVEAITHAAATSKLSSWTVHSVPSAIEGNILGSLCGVWFGGSLVSQTSNTLKGTKLLIHSSCISHT